MIKHEADFFSWLDSQLNEEIPSDVIAFNINVYESPFIIEVLGSNEFDVEDEDWACNEGWVPTSRYIEVSSDIFGNSWEAAVQNIINMAQNYLNSDFNNAVKLTQAKAFAIGFVDGDLNLVK
ncbi:hypothetical protein AN214_01891 [Pseudoalteromonas sp. P1-9]|uniref:hypothetical protein n=1 Tax=Pseudoalteromonas sp. P1-9 TaxID=1710354 RepID=UPI0006D63FD4|nr:hypothetical protein [Pseudoalteromonas sp. P1-9]KPV96082.1 hypothetical protein AN214_01891 [Pseudoalteromonas sp. P1-9]